MVTNARSLTDRVIFGLGYDPWWPVGVDPPDYFANGSPNSGYNYPSYGYDDPLYSYNYDRATTIRLITIMIRVQQTPADTRVEMYYDQNSYPINLRRYYNSGVYQTDSYYDQRSDSDESNNSTIVQRSERLAREGYYRGNQTACSALRRRKAVKNYQITNGLRALAT